MIKKTLLIISFSLIIGCSSDRDKIIGVWDVNAIIGDENLRFSKGTFEFEEDGTLLLKIGDNIEKTKWSSIKDTIIIDKSKFHYTLKNNRLKMIKKGKSEIYMDLIKQ